MSEGATPEGNGHTAEAVVLAKDSEGVVELRAVEMDPGAGQTSQEDTDTWTPTDTIPPPENLPSLSRLTRISQIRSTCIGVLTTNVVGLGWDVHVWPGEDAQVDKAEIRDARHSLDALARRDTRLDRPGLSDLMCAVGHDLEEFGNGYIEVSRNRRSGKIDGLYHLPGQLIRRKKMRSGWVMGQNPDLVSSAQRVDYYNFGEKVQYDDKGNPQPRLQTPQTGWKQNEVIAFRHYTSESRDYGLPRDIGLVADYAAYKYVIDWTSSFFGNSGTPPTILFVQGQELKDGTRVHFKVDASVVNRIRQSLQTDTTGNAKKVVVVPVPPGTNVHAEQLSQLSDRDITFGDFKKDHRNTVGSAFGLQPMFYGSTDDSGRYTAEVQRALCLEETFDPSQRYIEDKLWTTLMADLSFSQFRIVFKRLAVESDAQKREAAQNGATVGAITVGEWRDANGYGPLPFDGPIDDAKNPNNERFTPTAAFTGLSREQSLNPADVPGGDPHREVAIRATQDTRGLAPGIGGRPGPRDVPPVKDAQAKSGDHEGDPDVEAEVDHLAEELREYAATSE